MRLKQLIFALLLIPSVALAQDATCPTIVETALNLTRESCDGTENNEACYGHILLDAAPRPGLDEFQFEEPGDIVDLLAVESMRLSAMDTRLGQWGVLLMQVEAEVQRVADTLDSEEGLSVADVQMLLFGDVEFSDANRFLRLTALEDTTIYTLPDTTSDAVNTVPEGESVIVNARLEDNSWYRVRYTDRAAGLAWIQADALELNEEIDYLEAIPLDSVELIPASARARFGPMQAFTLSTGVNDAPCAEAPNSGMLIQTPEGVASVSLWLDEVVIQMNATAFVQAEAGGNLTIDVLEGAVELEADGEIVTAYAGTRVTVPLNDELGLAGAPPELAPLDTQAVQSLPVGLLDNPVDIPTPFDPSAGVPLSGDWRYQWGVASLTCPDGTEVPFVSDNTPATITVQDEGLQLSGVFYQARGNGIYRTTYTDGNGNLHQDTLTVQSLDFINGEKVLDLVSPVCTLTVPFSLSLISPFD